MLGLLAVPCQLCVEEFKEQGHLDCNARLQFHETVVRNCLGKAILQIALHIAQVVVLEIAIGIEVEADEDGHFSKRGVYFPKRGVYFPKRGVYFPIRGDR